MNPTPKAPLKARENVGKKVFLEVSEDLVTLRGPFCTSWSHSVTESCSLLQALSLVEFQAIGHWSEAEEFWPAIALACLRMRLRLRSYGYVESEDKPQRPRDSSMPLSIDAIERVLVDEMRRRSGCKAVTFNSDWKDVVVAGIRASRQGYVRIPSSKPFEFSHGWIETATYRLRYGHDVFHNFAEFLAKRARLGYQPVWALPEAIPDLDPTRGRC